MVFSLVAGRSALTLPKTNSGGKLGELQGKRGQDGELAFYRTVLAQCSEESEIHGKQEDAERERA